MDGGIYMKNISLLFLLALTLVSVADRVQVIKATYKQEGVWPLQAEHDITEEVQRKCSDEDGNLPQNCRMLLDEIDKVTKVEKNTLSYLLIGRVVVQFDCLEQGRPVWQNRRQMIAVNNSREALINIECVAGGNRVVESPLYGHGCRRRKEEIFGDVTGIIFGLSISAIRSLVYDKIS